MEITITQSLYFDLSDSLNGLSISRGDPWYGVARRRLKRCLDGTFGSPHRHAIRQIYTIGSAITVDIGNSFQENIDVRLRHVPRATVNAMHEQVSPLKRLEHAGPVRNDAIQRLALCCLFFPELRVAFERPTTSHEFSQCLIRSRAEEKNGAGKCPLEVHSGEQQPDSRVPGKLTPYSGFSPFTP